MRAEFLLEGMVAHRKLSRNEERGFAAQEKPARKQETHKMEIEYEEWERSRKSSEGITKRGTGNRDQVEASRPSRARTGTRHPAAIPTR